jgi:hypothetical protein
MNTLKSWWAKIPPKAQSAIRHLVVTFVVTFAVVAKPLLAGIFDSPDLKTAKALLLATVLAAGAAAVRVVVPLAIVYAKALIAWAFSRLAPAAK